MDSQAARLAQVAEVTQAGEWQRHVTARYVRQALDGRPGYGRWGTADGFPVLYLGRPRDSVIVEAYRHLVDPVEFDEPGDRENFLNNLVPQVLVTCSVNVNSLLDLRTALGRAQAELTMQDLTSPTTDRAAYARCQSVAQVAHQLNRNGIIAPAATELGETLALFMDLLPADQRPQRSREDRPWQRLPPDPRAGGIRHLSVVPS